MSPAITRREDGSRMVRVVRDVERCQGFGNCVLEADDVFDLDDDGLVVLLQDDVAVDDVERVSVATKACPVNAVWLDRPDDPT